MNIRKKILFLAILYFPGTVLHELSHYFAAKVLGVPTGRISLLPKFEETQVELGHVEIARTDFVRRFIIGIAPLITGICIIAAVLFFSFKYSYQWWIYILFGYIVLTILNSMHLSKSDLHGAWKILVILALALALIIALH